MKSQRKRRSARRQERLSLVPLLARKFRGKARQGDAVIEN
jgi:hypothetical protein